MVIKFNLTEERDGELSKDIEKVIKKDVSKKIDKSQSFYIKGESDI